MTRIKDAELHPALSADTADPANLVSPQLAMALLETAMTGLILIDADGGIRFVNDWVRQRWVPHGEIREQENIFSLLVNRQSGRLLPAIRSALQSSQSSLLSHYLNRTLLPLRGTSADQDAFELSQNIVIRPLSGGHLGPLCLLEITDVSVEAERERKLRGKAAELAKANHELERFTYAASHDLRAPLRALSILPDWIQEDLAEANCELPDEVLGHLDDMRQQSRRLDRLLSDLLDYCRVGWNDRESEETSIPDLIDEAVKVLQLSSNFEVVVEGEWPRINVIEVEILIILRNLISNAIKHHDKQSGSIIIRGHNLAGEVLIDVIDDGPGIPSQFHDRVFEMFRTLKPRDTVEGSGVGLSMVRRIIERWGGSINVDSPIDGERGSRFRLRLPGQMRAN